MTRIPFFLVLVALSAALALGACGSDDDDDDSSGGSDTAASTTATSACHKDHLPLYQSGKLTVGTDKPAFPPYFVDDDPANGKGFESAVAYAIADELGFSKAEVEWTVVPFNASYAPGEKKFDFDVNQISISPQREKVVDFSTPYYEAPQAIVVPKGSEYAGVTSLDEVKDARFGVQVGTTSLSALEDIVQPSSQPQVFNDSNDVVNALKNDQVDAIVVDLPTALYLTAAEIPGSTVAGQFSAPGGDRWGALLQKDSELTECVSQAVDKLRSSGELQELTDKWITEGAGAPELD